MSATRPGRPRRAVSVRCGAALLLLGMLSAALAEPPLPPRNLLVELREADTAPTLAGAAGWTVRSADAATPRAQPAQQLRVLNGASASVRIGVTRPLQVWRADPLTWLPVPGTQWVSAGQQMTVTPRWPGGSEPVTVALRAEASRFDPAVAPGSAELPGRFEARVETTLRAPLGEWVTVAASAAGDGDPDVVSSGQAAAAVQRVLQMRVSLAP